VTSSLAAATSSVGAAATSTTTSTSTGGAYGPAPTAAMAIGALMGGAAVFANF
jgi:hypothetical protein